MGEPKEITARDRIAAFRLAREADDLADQSRWAALILRPLARSLRWIATEDRDVDR